MKVKLLFKAFAWTVYIHSAISDSLHFYGPALWAPCLIHLKAFFSPYNRWVGISSGLSLTFPNCSACNWHAE